MPELVSRDEFLELSKKVDEAISNTNDKLGDSARRETVNRIFERLDKQKERILVLDAEVKVVKTIIEPLKELPDTLTSLRESMLKIGNSLGEVRDDVSTVKKTVGTSIQEVKDNVDGSINKVNRRIDIVEEGLELQRHRGKIDILDWLAKHWDKLALAAAVLYVLIQSTID